MIGLVLDRAIPRRLFRVPVGDGDDQPAADLNAMWYLRNGDTLGQLVNVARPGDRFLVVYGAGHRYSLRHLPATTPSYSSVDVMP